MGIQRWASETGDDGAEMWRDNEGDYVLFAEHEEAVRVLREALELARKSKSHRDHTSCRILQDEGERGDLGPTDIDNRCHQCKMIDAALSK